MTKKIRLQTKQRRVISRIFRQLMPLLFLTAVLSSTAQAVSFPGPDAYGYHGALVPLNLRDIRTSGTDLGLDNSDDDTATTPIGFSFNYYGNSYTQVEVSSNGFISFSPSGEDGCCSADPIPDSNNPNNVIAGWWQDMDTRESGIIRAETRGAVGSREFIVGFYDVADYDEPELAINTFEIILHEATGDIEIAIKDAKFDDADDKVSGIENADGSDGIEIIFVESDDPSYANGDSVLSNQGYCFSTAGTACRSASTPQAVPTLSALATSLLAGLLVLLALAMNQRRRQL